MLEAEKGLGTEGCCALGHADAAMAAALPRKCSLSPPLAHSSVNETSM